MLSGFMNMNTKSQRVADQIDAQVISLKNLSQNVKTTAQQFDFVESQLQQFAQIIGQHDPMASMQFQNMQQQINNIQTQVVNGLQQIEQGLQQIDSLTDKIQN